MIPLKGIIYFFPVLGVDVIFHLRRNNYAARREDFIAFCDFRLKEVDKVRYAIVKGSVFILLQNSAKTCNKCNTLLNFFRAGLGIKVFIILFFNSIASVNLLIFNQIIIFELFYSPKNSDIRNIESFFKILRIVFYSGIIRSFFT